VINLIAYRAINLIAYRAINHNAYRVINLIAYHVLSIAGHPGSRVREAVGLQGSEEGAWLTDTIFYYFVCSVVFNEALRFGRRFCFCLRARKPQFWSYWSALPGDWE